MTILCWLSQACSTVKLGSHLTLHGDIVNIAVIIAIIFIKNSRVYFNTFNMTALKRRVFLATAFKSLLNTHRRRRYYQ